MSNHSISTKQLSNELQSTLPPLIFDVRKRPAFDQDQRLLPGAKWQIHDEVEKWAANLDPHHQVIVYCVHGHEVSQNAAQALRDLGFSARYLEGGFDAWISSGKPVEGSNK